MKLGAFFSGTISCDFYKPKSRQCGPAAVRFSHRVDLGILAALGPGLSHPVQVLDIVPKVPRAGIEPATRSDSRHKSLALELTLASCCQESPLGTRR